jgi:hypothetical protein
MKTKKTLLNQILFLSLQLCFSTISWAQIKDTSSNIFEEQTLSSVVVTGQYKPTKPEDAVQRVRIIDSKKIAAMGAQNLRDAPDRR